MAELNCATSVIIVFFIGGKKRVHIKSGEKTPYVNSANNHLNWVGTETFDCLTMLFVEPLFIAAFDSLLMSPLYPNTLILLCMPGPLLLLLCYTIFTLLIFFLLSLSFALFMFKKEIIFTEI